MYSHFFFFSNCCSSSQLVKLFIYTGSKSFIVSSTLRSPFSFFGGCLASFNLVPPFIFFSYFFFGLGSHILLDFDLIFVVIDAVGLVVVVLGVLFGSDIPPLRPLLLSSLSSGASLSEGCTKANACTYITYNSRDNKSKVVKVAIK